MDIGCTSQKTGTYRVLTEVYEGPLDLLLQLIEHAELDITKLALAQVTDQYLEHIHLLQILDVGEVSAFLLIAARLLQIKSEVLLPRPPTRDPGEEDPGESLALQLLAYKRYRTIANHLAVREETGYCSYLRLAPPPKIEGILDLSGLTVMDLAAVARDIFSQADARSTLSTIVPIPTITIREKISLIARSLRKLSRISFHGLLRERRNRLDIAITFLAMLELIKRNIIKAHQERLFGDIELEAVNAWNETEDFELEFGE